MFARKLEGVGPHIKIKKCCAPHVLETSEEVGEFDTTPSCTHRLRYINNMNQCEINLKVIVFTHPPSPFRGDLQSNNYILMNGCQSLVLCVCHDHGNPCLN